ncbi:exodeoxyribonuclease VII small subunit [Helicobacter sp. TUL]|uniref:exodeoxyribonuclease VII small subunit n=1 Tax=unclassified Helicobacter TaxID=2593540 RepID=UPI000BAB9D1B|nr:exodeoxyribonuclease VII small subunit [Helicobacter sp. TUL]MCI7711134.1 exodeoxyribonuclease VII small subunit [Helicobacter sp.]MDD7346129.1 exodeoxyribonuclease VII small subunit [Helicobacter sp.]PAV00257.1 exodeoxyribonuclease VII small subunit [Helicobacter sp. TUL]
MQDVENQSFEELIENAKNIIARLGQSDVNLKEGVELYKNGMATLQKAQEMLESAKLEFEEIQKQSYDENTTRA